jgi:hypothetical protein
MTNDPMLNSGRPSDPQSWNRYSYARNTPLVNIDPTGLYDLKNNCQPSDKKCNQEFNQNAADLRAALARLQNQLNKVKDPLQKARIQAALNALGTEGDHNGVTVVFGPIATGAAGNTLPANDPTTFKETYTVTLDPKKNANIDEYAINAAHEGTHVDDLNKQIADPSLSPLSDFSQEYRGYQTSIWAAAALGLENRSYNYDGKTYSLWNGSWAAVDKNITSFVLLFHDSKGHQTHPETKPHNPWQN